MPHPCGAWEMHMRKGNRKSNGAAPGAPWNDKVAHLMSREGIPRDKARDQVILETLKRGDGNVLATLCDLTIASEKAVFGQVGPKVGSVDPGFGTAYLARLVGEKRAREIWYLCRRYTAKEAMDMGMVNAVVPADKLDEEVDKWCAEIREKSPTALAIAKRSFNADSENLRAIGALGFEALALFYGTEESKEGGRAFREKRRPRFRDKKK